MQDNAYAILLTPDDNGTVMVTSPDFAELVTFGEDSEDALLRAVDALEEAIAARMHGREPIPMPARHEGLPVVPLPAQTWLKVALYQAMHEQCVSKAEMARRLHLHGPQVDRLLDLRHASRLDSLESALHQLGKRVVLHTAPV